MSRSPPNCTPIELKIDTVAGICSADRLTTPMFVRLALSLGLLATGSQLISAVRQLSGVTGAKDPAGLLLVSYDLQQFKTAPAAADDFYARLLGEVQRLPGVEHAGLARPTALWTFGRGKGPSAVVVWLPEALSKDAQMLLGGFAGGDLVVPGQHRGADSLHDRAGGRGRLLERDVIAVGVHRGAMGQRRAAAGAIGRAG